MKTFVQNITNSNGNKVANQFIVETPEGRMFQSYRSNIAFISKNGSVTLGKDWSYSKTTAKYRNAFLGETTKETEAKLKSGVYKLDNNL